MPILAKIGTLIAKKGGGAVAKAIAKRTARKQMIAQTGQKMVQGATKVGFFSKQARALRKEQRQTDGGGFIRKAIDKRKAKKTAAGGGFLRRAITKRRERKAAGLLNRQVRRKNKYGQNIVPDNDKPIDNVSSFLGGQGAMFTGGEIPESEPAEKKHTIMDLIMDNWIVILLVGGAIWFLSTMKSKRK